MRSIRGVALGTYYAKGAAAARRSAHASGMRCLVYAVKDNRDTPNPPQLVGHARHPAAPHAVLVDRDNAVDYVAAIVARHLRRIQLRLGIEDGKASLVPIPSSVVTHATIESARWPALRLARRLEAVGLGRCVIAATNRSPVTPKTAGGRKLRATELAANFRVEVDPPARRIVLIDDVLTIGTHALAMDLLLRRENAPGIFVVGMTDSEGVADCYTPRGVEVRYDESVKDPAPSVIRRKV